jgi:mannose-1-phosphate guanylyltransferase
MVKRPTGKPCPLAINATEPEAGIPLGAALLEPVDRNTALALTLAALAALKTSPPKSPWAKCTT